MNINNEDTIVFKHALASRTDSVETKSNTRSSGAGVNASSRADMAFSTSDTLSELVWSPRNGLSLKCAESGLVENKPFILWDVGPSMNEASTSQSIRSKGTRDDKVEVEEKLNLERGSLAEASYELDARGVCCDAGRTDNMEEECGTSDEIWKEENPCCNGEQDLCSSKNVETIHIAEESNQKISGERDTLADSTRETKKIVTSINWQPSTKPIRRTRTRCNQNSRVEVNVSHSDIIRLTKPVLSDQKPLEDPVHSLPNFQSPWELGDEVTSASADVDKNKKSGILTKLESSSENDMVCLSEKVAHNSHRCPTDSGVHLYRENDKETALSNGDIHKSSSNSENDSMESCCNGAGLSSIKKRGGDELQLVGSKRLKRPVSSFMNWISNMVKVSNKQESSSSPTLDLTCSKNVCFGNNNKEHLMCSSRKSDCESPNMGFQSMFRSLYCRDTKMSKFELHRDNHSRGESEELLVANESEGNNVKNSSCKEIVPYDDQESPHISGNIVDRPIKQQIFASTPYACERSLADIKTSETSFYDMRKAADDTSHNISLSASFMPEKRNPSSSLWITRLYTRLENCKQITALDTTLEEEMPRFDANTSSNHFKNFAYETAQIELPQKFQNSEAMASVFAKRLDALRHIQDPSGRTKSSFSGSDFNEKQKCDFVEPQNGFPQEEMFHAVRRLRLSRADILRWMNSNVSLLHLNGFFLRLRVGKLEARVGGTGYYVARIAGDTVGNFGCNSEKSILVDVGGIKSSVGCQFVSNHDFLEDEIKDWWSRIETTGGKIPSLNELKSKFKDKTCLGF